MPAATPAAPASLRPKKADIILDKRYILAAMGLLAQSEPEIALQIMKEEIN
ncbi:MAG: glutamate mutase L [Acutalibacteraceae bacterium]